MLNHVIPKNQVKLRCHGQSQFANNASWITYNQSRFVQVSNCVSVNEELYYEAYQSYKEKINSPKTY